MTRNRTRAAFMMAGAVMLLAAAVPAQAAPVQWDVDSTASFVRLNIPDQALNLDGTTATIRLRDAGSTSSWTDAGGRRAFLDGTIETNYTDGSSIQFLGGSHNLVALEQTQLRPNPASFNPAATDSSNPNGTFTNSSTALAALGARVRASISILTVDAAFLALRQVMFDIASGSIALGGGTTIAGNTTALGIQSSLGSLDGLSVIIVGQVIPDTLNAPISTPNTTNTAGGTITVIDPLTRRLDLTVNMPLSLDLDGTLISGSVTGQIRAFAIIPEPSTLAMAGVGIVGLGLTAYRRRRVRK